VPLLTHVPVEQTTRSDPFYTKKWLQRIVAARLDRRLSHLFIV